MQRSAKPDGSWPGDARSRRALRVRRRVAVSAVAACLTPLQARPCAQAAAKAALMSRLVPERRLDRPPFYGLMLLYNSRCQIATKSQTAVITLLRDRTRTRWRMPPTHSVRAGHDEEWLAARGFWRQETTANPEGVRKRRAISGRTMVRALTARSIRQACPNSVMVSADGRCDPN